jgi:pyruvate kinase
VNNPIPTRAEASDVANAVWDGTDVVMLSAETSVGKYPVRAVEIMKEIIGKAESTYRYEPNLNFEVPTDTQERLFDYMNKSIVTMSRQINAKAILAFSSGGNTPSSLSKFRPQAQIIAITDNFDAMNLLSLRWGVSSIFFENINDKYKAVQAVKKKLAEKKLVKPGEFIIFTEGGPKAENIRENWIRFEAI